MTLRLLLENNSSTFGHINQLFFVLNSVQEFTLLISNIKALKSEVFSHISWPERMLWSISSAECCPLLEVQGTVFLTTTSLEYQRGERGEDERRSATVVSVRMTKAFHSEIYLICGLGRYQVVITVQPRVVQLISFMAWAQDSHSNKRWRFFFLCGLAE